MSACAPAEKAAPAIESPARAEAAAPPVLAEVANQAAGLDVQVLAARRIAPDTLRLELALVDRRPPGAADEAPGGPEGGAARAARAALTAFEQMSIVSPDGRRRVFALRDSANRLVWSGLEPPGPGERRQIWAHFPAPNGDHPQVSLALPGWPPINGITVR